MRVLFLTARRVPAVPSPVLVEAARILTARGMTVDTLIAEEAVWRPERLAISYDLVVLKSHTELALSLAATLHAHGVPLLNPYPSCAALQDKLVAASRLHRAGVPVPASWTTGDPALLAGHIEQWPVIVKPHRGHRGTGVCVVRGARELAALGEFGEPVIVQQFVPGPGTDLKVYVAGREVSAVRKPFAADSFTRPGEPVPVSAEVREIALRCGDAFGLGLYGLDVIESPAGPFVVDVNYFPGYKGVPGAAAQIAEYIDGYAHGRHELALPDLALPDLAMPGVPRDLQAVS
jgi:ribosomal protein S6--L-glutamate ligase